MDRDIEPTWRRVPRGWTALALAALCLTAGCPTAGDGDAADDDHPADDDDTAGDDDTVGDDDATSDDDDATPCPTFAERLRVTAVDVSPAAVSVGSPSGFSANRPVILSPRPDGSGAQVAWSASDGSVHVTPLDGDDGRAGPDVVLDGSEVRGFVAHDDGGAVLLRRDDEMVLVRFDEGGDTTWERSFVGGNDHDSEGDKWIDEWGHEGRLAWSGGVADEYAAYFGHTQNWGQNGNHQGDLLAFVGAGGEILGGGWSWGCSHSVDGRLVYSGELAGPVCVSDCYPDKGIYYQHYTEVFADPSGDCWGSTDAELGGLVSAGGGFWLTFASPEGRSSVDVGLVSISAGGEVGAVRWLTDTATVDEHAPYLARYGDHLLAAWHVGGVLHGTVIDPAGGELEPLVALDARIAERDDMVGLPGGDVAWAYAWDSNSELKVVRLGWCE